MAWPYSPQEVMDRLGIYDMYARYAHALDAQDFDTLDRDVFLPETVFDWAEAGGERLAWPEAREGDLLRARTFPLIFHFSGVYQIDFEEPGDRARVKTKMLHPSGLYGPDGTPQMFQVQGGYDDVLVRTQAGWRIIERVWRHFWVVGGLEYVGDGMTGMAEGD